MGHKNSALTFILSPRRGEAEESHGRINVMAIERTGSPLLNEEERGRVRS
jgi:hypothetical protein